MIPYVYDPSTPQERIDEDLAIRLRTFPTADGYLAQLQGITGWESCSRLKQLRAPVLVIHGESDRLVPPANGRRLAREIPGARLLMLSNASHVFFTDQPEAAHRAVLDFVAEAERAAA
jgi:3-oxoadipate enol-lactonase